MAAGSNPRATSGTSDKAFVDSNVLIYAHDVDAGRKRDVAKGLLRDLWLTLPDSWEWLDVLVGEVDQGLVSAVRGHGTQVPREVSLAVITNGKIAM